MIETEETLRKQKKAIEVFVKVFGGSYQKLGPLDVDYKIFDKDKKLIAYAETVVRERTLRSAYPLGVQLNKLAKLIDKRLNPVLVWSCEDGIIYGRAEHLIGEVRLSDRELTVFYEKQKALKYVKFI